MVLRHKSLNFNAMIAQCISDCLAMNRNKLITIRVSESELEQVRVMAVRRRKSVAEYLRWLVDRDEALFGSEKPYQDEP